MQYTTLITCLECLLREREKKIDREGEIDGKRQRLEREREIAREGEKGERVRKREVDRRKSKKERGR